MLEWLFCPQHGVLSALLGPMGPWIRVCWRYTWYRLKTWRQ